MLITTFFFVSGTRPQNLSAPFSYTLDVCMYVYVCMYVDTACKNFVNNYNSAIFAEAPVFTA
jgi:hypothetical protein